MKAKKVMKLLNKYINEGMAHVVRDFNATFEAPTRDDVVKMIEETTFKLNRDTNALLAGIRDREQSNRSMNQIVIQLQRENKEALDSLITMIMETRTKPRKRK